MEADTAEPTEDGGYIDVTKTQDRDFRLGHFWAAAKL